MAFLIQANEGAEPIILPLGRSVLLIGRDEDSNLYLEASEISKNHASILGTDGGYLLKDNGSTNGTIVNGQKVTERRLEHGDTIQFGPYQFRVDLRNPLPETPAAMEDTEVKHSGNSYTNLIKLKEIKGAEKSGQLRVVVSAKEAVAVAKPVVDLPCAGLLATMSADERRMLAGLGSMRKANAGSTIVKQGSDMNELILILSGSLEARLDGAAKALGRIEAGDWIGELNVFDPSGAGCSVNALEDTSYWAISRSNLEGFLGSNQRAGIQLLIGLANTLGKRLRQSLNGAMPVKKPRSVFPWIVASAATGVAILAGIGFFNERQNTGFRVAEMTSLLAERDAELQAAQQLVRKLKAAASREESARIDPPPTQSVPDQQPERLSDTPKEDAPPSPPEQRADRPPVPAGKPAPESAAIPVAGGISYPPEVTITKKTQVPLEKNGVVTGSLTLSEGVELLVLGKEGEDVIVEIGGASKKIPKDHTNFSTALAEAMANPSAPTPTPFKKETAQSTPEPKPLVTHSKKEVSSGPVTIDDLSQIVGMVKLLNVLEEVQNLKGASKSAVSRFVKIQESKWEKAAASATELLGRGEVPQDYSAWLTKFIEASKMFNTVRFPLLERQLSELDREWVSLQARDAVSKPHSSQ